MNYNDPSRPTSNWRPCWLDSSIALPALRLYPHPIDSSQVTLAVYHGQHCAWLSKDIPLTTLIQILHFWTEDPEGTFLDLFGLDDWPRHSPRPVSEPEKSTKSTHLTLQEALGIFNRGPA